MWPEANQHFSKEIDDEANSYFQRIYNHPPHPTMSVDEVCSDFIFFFCQKYKLIWIKFLHPFRKLTIIVPHQVLEMLQRFKDSTIKREREVFNCMLRNLFEEYRFFPQYPDKELHITACLFGGIIEKGLVTYMALGLALRYVLEALRKPYGSKMYYFGIAALDRFKNRYWNVFFCKANINITVNLYKTDTSSVFLDLRTTLNIVNTWLQLVTSCNSPTIYKR